MIEKLLSTKTIVFLEDDTRDGALQSLVQVLTKAKKVKDPEAFYNALLAREKIVSTAIGMGVAIPHAKLPSYKNFFIAIGIQKKEGIEWESLDGAPVRLIFMIGGPDDRQSEYLHILSSLTAAIKNPETRKALLTAETPEQVLEYLK